MKKRQITHPHTIRFPDDVYAEVQRVAERQERSFNSQVIFLLKKSLQDPPPSQNGEEEEEDS